MKVLLVNGGPHKNGCTRRALGEIAEALRQNDVKPELIWLGNEPYSSCLSCYQCFETGRCVVDDYVNVFLDKAMTADGFVFGSPVHYAAATGALTSFMDRVFFGKSKVFRGKPAAAVVSCRRSGATAALDQINKYFMNSQMPVVSSQYWNMVHGNTPEEVERDEEGLQIMRTLGRNMAWMLKCFQAGKQAGIEMPEPEPRRSTNFIR